MIRLCCLLGFEYHTLDTGHRDIILYTYVRQTMRNSEIGATLSSDESWNLELELRLRATTYLASRDHISRLLPPIVRCLLYSPSNWETLKHLAVEMGTEREAGEDSKNKPSIVCILRTYSTVCSLRRDRCTARESIKSIAIDRHPYFLSTKNENDENHRQQLPHAACRWRQWVVGTR